MSVLDPCGCLDGQPGLARPSGAGEGEEAGGDECVGDVGDFTLPAHEAGDGHGEVAPAGVEASNRREVGFEPRSDHLEQMLGVGQVLQAMLAEVAERDALQAGRLGQGPGCRRHQDLLAVARGGDADVAVAAELPVAGVESHAHADPAVGGPFVRADRPLGLDRAGHRSRCAGERDEEGVALGVDLRAARGDEDVAKDAVVLLQDRAVALRELPEKARAALDVGEHEGDRSGGELAGGHVRPVSVARLWLAHQGFVG